MLVFLWWGGSWLSALVNIFKEIWFENILVIDKSESEITEKLKKKWIKIIIWEWKYNFQPEDIIIYSDAVVNSQDFKNAKNNRKFSYFEFIWEVSKRFQTISIAGTHGKTSTTSMAISSAKKLNFQKLALWIVGWFVKELNNQNYFINPDLKWEIKTIFEKILSAKWARPANLFKKYFFVIEADEFNRHFLLLDSYISLITKVDHDHKDIYPTEKEYLEAFKLFVLKTRKKTFTTDKSFFSLLDWKIPSNLDLVLPTSNIDFDYIFWDHMKNNALLVLKLFLELWFKKEEILKALKSFKWVWRRQEYLGDISGNPLYTDYAHHPVEIKATYESFRQNFPDKKLIAVFQPHQLFRFVSYEQDFIESLKKFDKIYIYDIYSVRENKLIQKLIKERNLKAKDHQEAIKQIWNQIAEKLNWEYADNFSKLIQKLEKEKWIIIVMTAWDLDYKLRKLFTWK